METWIKKESQIFEKDNFVMPLERKGYDPQERTRTTTTIVNVSEEDSKRRWYREHFWVNEWQTKEHVNYGVNDSEWGPWMISLLQEKEEGGLDRSHSSASLMLLLPSPARKMKSDTSIMMPPPQTYGSTLSQGGGVVYRGLVRSWKGYQEVVLTKTEIQQTTRLLQRSKLSTKHVLGMVLEKYRCIIMEKGGEWNVGVTDLVGKMQACQEVGLMRDLLLWEHIWVPTRYVIDVCIDEQVEYEEGSSEVIKSLGREIGSHAHGNTMVSGLHLADNPFQNVMLGDLPHQGIPKADPKQFSEEKRNSVILEIFMTESSYVARLKVVKLVYLDPLRRAITEAQNRTDDFPSAAEIRLIFSGVEDILDTNESFLTHLNCLIYGGDDGNQSLGDVILKHVQKLEVYRAYISFYQTAINTLRRCVECSPTFAGFLQYCQSLPESQRLSLADLMQAPIQRIPQYILLIHNLLKNTPEDHEDYAKLEQCYGRMKRVAEHINETKKQFEDSKKLFQVEQLVESFPVQLISASRWFVASADFVQKDMSNWQKGKDRTIFLFNDSLMITKRRKKQTGLGSKKKKRPYKFIMSLGFNDCCLIDLSMSEVITHAFKFQIFQHSEDRLDEEIFFSADSEATKLDWICKVESAMKVFFAKEQYRLIHRTFEEGDLWLRIYHSNDYQKAKNKSPVVLMLHSSKNAKITKERTFHQNDLAELLFAVDLSPKMHANYDWNSRITIRSKNNLPTFSPQIRFDLRQLNLPDMMVVLLKKALLGTQALLNSPPHVEGQMQRAHQTLETLISNYMANSLFSASNEIPSEMDRLSVKFSDTASIHGRPSLVRRHSLAGSIKEFSKSAVREVIKSVKRRDSIVSHSSKVFDDTSSIRSQPTSSTSFHPPLPLPMTTATMATSASSSSFSSSMAPTATTTPASFYSSIPSSKINLPSSISSSSSYPISR